MNKLNEEVWKDVVGYEGLYEVSSHGQVRTHKDKVTYSKQYKKERKWKQRTLKEKNKKGRDVRVDLWKEGKPKTFLVHRLVAFAFIPTVEGKESINHIDGDPRNNHVSNLEWCDHKENNNHAFNHGLMVSTRVIVFNVETKEKTVFRSMQKASLDIGRASSYIGQQFRKNPPNHKDGKFIFFKEEDESKFSDYIN